MTNNSRREPAKIIEFPTLARRAGGPRGAPGQPAQAMRLPAFPAVECGSGWYHEEALREGDRTRRS